MSPTFRDPEEVLDLWTQLALERADLLREMRRVRDTYNGDLEVDLPEQFPWEEPAIPNLLEQGVDQIALRVASTMPDVTYPALRPGKVQSEERARKRRLANLAWWEMNGYEHMLQRRASELLAYAVSPVQIRPRRWPDGTVGPWWQQRDPFGTYPGDTTNPDEPNPSYCIFAYVRPWSWVARHYGEAAIRIERPKDIRGTDEFTLLEFVDGEEVSTFLLGGRERMPSPAVVQGVRGRDSLWTPRVMGGSGWEGMAKVEPLERVRNRTGVCTASVPQRTTLDRPKGKFTGMIGKYIAEARLFALEYIAVTKGVFADEWIYNQDPNIEPKIVQEPDGRKGVYGILMGGQVQPIVTQPGYMTNPLRDWLERGQRIDGGIVADLTGESPTNVRTGRRGDAVLGATIDFTIQAAQRMLQRSAQWENTCAALTEAEYAPSQKRSFYYEWQKSSGTVDYRPSDIWESSRNVVRFPFAGADLGTLIIQLGQLRGLEAISLRGLMENIPLIRDVEQELDRLAAERTREAFWAWIDNQIAQGAFEPQDIERFTSLILSNEMSPEEALRTVQREAQERQSPEVEPVAPTSPEAQPGVGMPTPPGAATVGPVEPSMQGFSQLLRSVYPAQAAMRQASGA